VAERRPAHNDPAVKKKSWIEYRLSVILKNLRWMQNAHAEMAKVLRRQNSIVLFFRSRAKAWMREKKIGTRSRPDESLDITPGHDAGRCWALLGVAGRCWAVLRAAWPLKRKFIVVSSLIMGPWAEHRVDGHCCPLSLRQPPRCAAQRAVTNKPGFARFWASTCWGPPLQHIILEGFRNF